MTLPGTFTQTLQIQIWFIDKLVFDSRNPRKNAAAVDRMWSSIREFGFKVPVLARSDGEVVEGHLRLEAGRKLGINEAPVILCDEWTPQQVKAFRLMVNRSVTEADWDEELLSLELQDLNAADFDLSLTGFDPGEIDGPLAIPDEERANAAPPLSENPVSRVGDFWVCTGYSAAMLFAWKMSPGSWRPQTAANGHGSALRHRVGLRAARPGRFEWPRARGTELREEADAGPYGNHNLG